MEQKPQPQTLPPDRPQIRVWSGEAAMGLLFSKLKPQPPARDEAPYEPMGPDLETETEDCETYSARQATKEE